MKYISSLSLSIMLTGCTIPDLRHPNDMIILGIPTHIGSPGYRPGYHRPHPWVYPDSVFCEWHPDLCVGDNDL